MQSGCRCLGHRGIRRVVVGIQLDSLWLAVRSERAQVLQGLGNLTGDIAALGSAGVVDLLVL